MKKVNVLILLCAATINLFAWDGNGTIGNPYKVSSPQDLIDLSNAEESFEGVYFQQTQNIDMQAYQSFTAIGAEHLKGFKGSYDGQNFEIKNLRVTDGFLGSNIALFGYLRDGAEISNVRITGNSIMEGESSIGSIAGECQGTVTIQNCSSSATIVAEGGSVGGIVGSGSIVKNCTFTGSVTVDYEYANNTGGIAGSVSKMIVFCNNYGAVTGTDRVGGICGILPAGGEMSDCYNSGSVTGVGDNVGGVAGYVSSGLTYDAFLTRCHNSGNVKGDNSVGGVAGYAVKAENSGNTGNVEGKGEYVGGVVGQGRVSLSYNRGDVTGDTYVGGVSGNLKEMDNCYNAGNVSGNDYVGGIFGAATTTDCTLSNSYNAGAVSATGTAVGGIGGYVKTGGLINSNFIQNAYWNIDMYAGPGMGNESELSEEQFVFFPKTSAELRDNFSATLGIAVWKEDDLNINNGYPILRDEVNVSIEDYPSTLSNVNVYSYGNQIRITNETQIEIKQVEVFDISGRSIYQKTPTQSVETITLNVATGMYFVRLSSGRESKAYKVVLTR